MQKWMDDNQAKSELSLLYKKNIYIYSNRLHHPHNPAQVWRIDGL